MTVQDHLRELLESNKDVFFSGEERLHANLAFPVTPFGRRSNPFSRADIPLTPYRTKAIV